MFVFISINNSPGAWWLGPLTLMLSLCAQYGWGPSWQGVVMLMLGACIMAFALLAFKLVTGHYPAGAVAAWQQLQRWWAAMQQEAVAAQHQQPHPHGPAAHAQQQQQDQQHQGAQGGWQRRSWWDMFTQQAQQHQQQHQQQGRQQPPRRRPPGFDAVAHALQRLPTETVSTAEELQQLPVHELKERLQRLGLNPASCLEKRELVEQLQGAGGSSGATCSICCEDYVSEDVVRVLPCSHRYHLECIDKWFLSSTDRTKEPACPMCNHPLPL